MSDYEVFELGDIALQSGMTLRGTWLADKTYGRLNEDKSLGVIKAKAW
jgi:homoserine O-acetyltransferase/O-succinyltransferase